MKVSEMIKGLREFMEEHGDMDCYYSADDEGNAYRPVHYTPSKYYIDEDYEVYQEEDLEYYELSTSDVKPVCIVN